MKSIFLKLSLKKICLLFLMLAFPFLGYSQSVWVHQPKTEATVGLEAMIPSLEGDGADSPTGVMVIYSQIPFSNNYSLQLEVPIVRLGDLDTEVSNPYLGIEYVNYKINLAADLGVRLPVSEELGVSPFGIVVNPYNIGAFLPNMTTVLLNLDYRYVIASPGVIVRIGGGPHLLLPDAGESELLMKYYGQVLFDTGKFLFGGGLLGLVIITAEVQSIEERTLHSFGLMGSYDFGTLNAGAYLHLPLNNMINEVANYVVGLNLTVSF